MSNSSAVGFAHQRLDAFRMAMELAEGVARMTKGLPRGFSDLRNQLQRSAPATVRHIARAPAVSGPPTHVLGSPWPAVRWPSATPRSKRCPRFAWHRLHGSMVSASSETAQARCSPDSFAVRAAGCVRLVREGRGSDRLWSGTP